MINVTFSYSPVITVPNWLGIVNRCIMISYLVTYHFFLRPFIEQVFKSRY